MTKQKFSLEANFLSVDSQEEGTEVDLKNDSGVKTGFKVRLAGPDSARRKRTKDKMGDYLISIGAISSKGKPGEVVDGSSATLAELQLDDMVAATISWTFPEGTDAIPCTPSEVRKLYSRFPTLYARVREAAEDIARFTKS